MQPLTRTPAHTLIQVGSQNTHLAYTGPILQKELQFWGFPLLYEQILNVRRLLILPHLSVCPPLQRGHREKAQKAGPLSRPVTSAHFLKHAPRCCKIPSQRCLSWVSHIWYATSSFLLFNCFLSFLKISTLTSRLLRSVFSQCFGKFPVSFVIDF